MNTSNNDGHAEGRRRRLRRKIVPISTLLLVTAITIVIFLNRERVPQLAGYGYVGAFLVSLFGNATVLLPGIVLPILSGLGVMFYSDAGLSGPIAVGLAGGVGAAIGEIVGYMAGYSGRGIVENKELYQRLAAWVQRWGAVAIFVFALAPLFFDLVGIVAGALRFSLGKFVVVCWLGRTLLYTVIVTLAALGWKAALPYLG